jgi:predicted ATPase
MPPGLLTYVEHRSALLVLDNLEQVSGADQVVAALLAAAPKLVVLTSSRRPLMLVAEHQYPVPPLELPGDSSLDGVAASGAVQLFVGRARQVKPSFRLTAINAGDVAEVCQRLDGLPLALELAAARLRLLSPAALLARLDTALELRDNATDRPTRQQTLRGTIRWSYDLLDPTQQSLFRALGVFADGADLEAVKAVTTHIDSEVDRLDLVAELVDANLVTVTEDRHGEPRIGMLATIHAFASAELAVSSDQSTVHRKHAEHYLQLADRLHAIRKVEYLEARSIGATEVGNFRQALDWLLAPHGEADDRRRSLGLRLSVALCWLWRREGYLAEGQDWCERAIERADGMPSRELASCLHWLAEMLLSQGKVEYARDAATRSLAMARSLGDQDATAFALASLATVHSETGDLDGSDDFLHLALATSKRSRDRHREAATLGDLAINALFRRDFDTAQKFASSALAMSREIDAVWLATKQRLLLAELLAITERIGEAYEALASLIDDVLQLADVSVTAELADIYVVVLAQLDDPIRAAQMLGAADAVCDRIGLSRPRTDEATDVIAAARGVLGDGRWDRHYQLGRAEDIEELLHDISSKPPDALETGRSSPAEP